MKRAVLCVLCFLSVLQAIAQPMPANGSKYADVYYYADSLFIAADDFKGEWKATVEQLASLAGSAGNAELEEELNFVVMKRHYTHNSGVTAPDFESKLIAFRNRVAAAGMKYQYVNALQLLGAYYLSELGKPSLSFETYLAAYKIYNNYPAKEFPSKREYIYTLGTAYYNYEDYQNAIKYLKQALATQPSAHKDLFFALHNTLGVCYRKLGMYDSADWYFRKVLEKKDVPYNGIAKENIGINYFYQGRYDEAIPLLEEEVSRSITDKNNIKNAANSLWILSRIALLRGDVAKAEALVLQGLRLAQAKKFWPDYQLAEHLYVQLHKVYTVKKEFALANIYADSALAAKDSFQVKYNTLTLSRAQEQEEYMQHKLDEEQLINQRRVHELIRNSLIACIILLTAIGILLINRQRIRRKRLEMEKRNAEAELDSAQSKLDAFRHSAQEKNQLIEHFTHEIERIKAGEAEQADNELRSKLERATLLTDEQWENFRVTFELVHKGFFGALKKKMPDLTQAEIRFLALSKLKLTSKEMASMLGVSPNAIRINRHRLRKKLDLDKDDMIDELVDDI